MKYLNKSQKSLRFSLIILFTVITILAVSLFTVFTIFPIKLNATENTHDKNWLDKFVVFWPESPLQIAIKERKRLKRYARTEIERRLENERNKMHNINSTIYDLWLDKNVVSNIENKFSSKSSSFVWPTFADNRHTMISPNTSPHINAPFVALPDQSKVKIQKGLYLGTGEYIKSHFPFATQRRYLIIEVLPLSPGNIRAYLGQYVWSKTFTAYDINKPARFVVPIYDTLGQQFRLSNITSNLYILEFKISTLSNSGRETIYFSDHNPLWTANLTEDLEETDPLYQTSNPKNHYSGSSTLAKGYNTLFINLNTLDTTDLLSKKFSKMMPNFSALLSDSVVFYENYDSTEHKEKEFYLPEIYKKYGYKTALFTNTSSIQMVNEIAEFADFNEISKNWLTTSDAQLKQQNTQKETEDKDLEGLSAVFKPESKEELHGFTEAQKEKLSEYLTRVNKLSNGLHQFKSEENFILSNNRYGTELLNSINTWIKPQTQNRLFVEIDLNPKNAKSKPTFQNLLSAFFKKPTLNFKNLTKYTQMRFIDQEIKYFLEMLQAQHITHRTILFFNIINQEDPSKSTAVVYIPGLLPKQQFTQIALSLKDLKLYALDLVGISAERTVKFYDSYKKAETQRTVNLPLSSNQSDDAFIKYHLLVYPNKENCENFMWNAPSEQIENLQANFPIYQLESSNKIKIYPCQFKEKTLKMTWYQKKLPSEASTQKAPAQTQHVHGYFSPIKGSKMPVELYYGKKLMLRQNFPLNFQHSKTQMDELFIVDEKEIDQIQQLAIQSFKLMRSDANLVQATQASLLMTKVRD